MAMKMAVASMEMASGGTSPSRRRARTEILSPETCSRWRRLWNFSRIVASIFRVFATERLYRRKGSLGGVLGDTHHRGRPPLGRAAMWGGAPLAPLWSLFGALEPSVKYKIVGFCFVQFREYFLCKISETKNSRKQELVLRYLVNRLVPENASKRYKV